MLRDGGEGDVELVGEFLGRQVTRRKQIEQAPPVRIGDRVKNVGF